MADRATRPDDDPLRDIVDLNKDERWQARLEEARARREIALREKGLSGGTPVSKPKPWESELDDDPDDYAIEPLIPQKEPEEGRVDFADRVDAMREVISRDKDASKKADVPVEAPRKRISKPTDFDEIIPPKAQPVDVSAEKSARAISEGLVPADAPDVADLAARYAASLEPKSREPIVAEPEPDIEVEETPVVEDAPAVTVRRRPNGLVVLLLAFAALPFAVTPPPMVVGPPAVTLPVFKNTPALGLTTSMLWRPVESFSGEWIPPVVIPPSGPLSVAPSAGAVFARSIEPLSSVPATAPSSPSFQRPVSTAGRPALPGPVASPPAQGHDDLRGLRAAPSLSPVPLPRPTDLDVPTNGAARVPPALPQTQGGLVTPVSRPRAEPVQQEEVIFVSAEDAPVPAIGTPLRITVLVPADGDRNEAEVVASEIVGLGHDLARVKQVDLSISTRNLRYFHDADREQAAELAASYGATLRDFSWFRPKPVTGTVELWLSGN